jgi:hypothetical protein
MNAARSLRPRPAPPPSPALRHVMLAGTAGRTNRQQQEIVPLPFPYFVAGLPVFAASRKHRQWKSIMISLPPSQNGQLCAPGDSM